MRERIAAFAKYYVFWVLFFMAQKPLFMLWQHGLLGDVRWTDWFLVPWHGLPLDLSVAAYLTAFYGLLLCLSFLFNTASLRMIANGYTAVVLAVAVLAVIGDNGCFPAWGYHINRDIFDYLASPKEVLACAPWWQWCLGFVGAVAMFALWWLVYRFFVATKLQDVGRTKSRFVGAALMLLFTALLFLPMRGSVTVSTMNTGRVYYSPNRMLNLAAVNPVFNVVESLSENTLDSERYRYMSSDEAARLFAELRPSEGTPSEYFLTTERPDIVLFILESFSRNALFAMPNLQRLAAEGVYFSNAYANSFRTDRGVMAVLGAFPGCATTSVMTVPDKSARLPQIGQVLKAEGYDLKFYYGGDEDFTNMRSYLMTGGFEKRVCDRDFPLADRLSKWGVPDHILFDYAAHEIAHRTSDRRTFDVILSLSSHEPFDVPQMANFQQHSALTSNSEAVYLNAIAYTDSCLGAFVDTLRRSSAWDNTLIILVADHGYPYPQGIRNYDPLRFRIPLVMTGGAVRQPQEITTLCSQIDWVPTLLHQMHLPASQFGFAKDILDTTQTPYAYYNFVDGFALVTPADTTIIDAVTNTPLNEKMSKCENDKMVNAITQRIYESLD